MDMELVLMVTTLVCAVGNLGDFLITRRGGILLFPASGWSRLAFNVLGVAVVLGAGMRLAGILPSGYVPIIALSCAIISQCYSVLARHNLKATAE